MPKCFYATGIVGLSKRKYDFHLIKSITAETRQNNLLKAKGGSIMSLINVKGLTFSYEGSYENIFENTSFQVDTDWKLGFIGRNGRGKTTFLNLLMGRYSYQGEISSSVDFTYFPFPVYNEERETLTVIRESIGPFEEMQRKMEALIEKGTEEALYEYGEVLEKFNLMDGYIIDEKIQKEASMLGLTEDILNRPFNTLSNGERTKALLSGLFLRKDNFLLIDEPTDHLDLEGRHQVSDYLSRKKGFIVVSHDRAFLDKIIDHVLVINKNNIEVQKGNYSSWQFNKDRQDSFELEQNMKLKKEISRLTESARQKAQWSDKLEASKIGSHVYDRGAVGAQAARIMKKSKNAERRANDALEEKKALLKNIEKQGKLKIQSKDYHKDLYIEIKSLSAGYGDKEVFENVHMQLFKGDRLLVKGKNGKGKSTLIGLISGRGKAVITQGELYVPPGLTISYVSQNADYLKGSMKEFILEEELDEVLFKSILRNLGFPRESFEKNIEELSSGQRKKLLIARSLSGKAHIYIWDEPLNYVDIISRIQIEELILSYRPTMIFIEHDEMFGEKIATKVLEL